MNPQKRLQNLIAYGQTTTAMQDGGAMPLVQANFNDIQTLDGLGIVQHFGFSSSPPSGTNVLALFHAGDKSKGTILGTLHPASRRRMLITGETTVYDLWGNEVHLAQSGITIKHATQVTIACPLSQINGNLMVTGSITATGEVMARSGAGQVLLSAHVHSQNGSPPTPGT